MVEGRAAAGPTPIVARAILRRDGCSRRGAIARSGQLLYLDTPILHLADIAFEADRAGGWNFQRSL